MQTIKDNSNRRLTIRKTYKMYIGGAFPRSESGHYYSVKNINNNEIIMNVCRATRKDLRNSVSKARNAFEGWSSAKAYLRGQILYRIAEMLEGRANQFVEELVSQGVTPADAEKEVNISVDRFVYYAGWCDKYQQISSTVNPVASSHFNFTVPEPMGVVFIIAPEESSLLGIVSQISPCVAGGNSAIALANHERPLAAVSLAEVLHSSDLPGGVVNILTGFSKEILPHAASHMDIDSLIYCGSQEKTIQLIQDLSSENMKRVVIRKNIDWYSHEQTETPYWILDTQEKKTTWHPIENYGDGGAKY